VFGPEAQGNWANLSAFNASLFNLGTTNQTNIDALALFTGQIGFTMSSVLWYVKGGAALAHNTYNGLVAGVAFDQANETRWGAAVGTGIEVGFAPSGRVRWNTTTLSWAARTSLLRPFPSPEFLATTASVRA
jgi:outer membrane immunogenic protein